MPFGQYTDVTTSNIILHSGPYIATKWGMLGCEQEDQNLHCKLWSSRRWVSRAMLPSARGLGTDEGSQPKRLQIRKY